MQKRGQSRQLDRNNATGSKCSMEENAVGHREGSRNASKSTIKMKANAK